jgi:hypothetical protein
MEYIDILNPKNITIPKKIFQMHKSIWYVRKRPDLRRAIQSWRDCVPEFIYNFYTDEMCDVFMKTVMTKTFGDKIYEAYNKLPIPSMKANLWRYCIIYKYGGIYADADTVRLCKPQIFTDFDTMIVCAPEDDYSYLCHWCFSAPAKSPILESVIQLSIERILSLYEIKSHHINYYIAGSGAFSDGIEVYLLSKKFPTFKERKEYFSYKNHTMICFKHELFHKYIIQHLFISSSKENKEDKSV